MFSSWCVLTGSSKELLHQFQHHETGNQNLPLQMNDFKNVICTDSHEIIEGKQKVILTYTCDMLRMRTCSMSIKCVIGMHYTTTKVKKKIVVKWFVVTQQTTATNHKHKWHSFGELVCNVEGLKSSLALKAF